MKKLPRLFTERATFVHFDGLRGTDGSACGWVGASTSSFVSAKPSLNHAGASFFCRCGELPPKSKGSASGSREGASAPPWRFLPLTLSGRYMLMLVGAVVPLAQAPKESMSPQRCQRPGRSPQQTTPLPWCTGSMNQGIRNQELPRTHTITGTVRAVLRFLEILPLRIWMGNQIHFREVPSVEQDPTGSGISLGARRPPGPVCFLEKPNWLSLC
mmetsp:Transcript_6210/g.15519  ORF Transcript_6210/g.15519 Transcript_6210/m.15519 type:complete len:214 (-) Transcript_6210:1020-1661(-)